MTTFLRNYFSDDPSGEESFYPRVYQKFLQEIDAARAPLVDERVGQDVILAAHDVASEDFLRQIRTELRYLTPLDEGELVRVLGALKEQATPFVAKDFRRTMSNKLRLSRPKIDATFDAMKEMGVFRTAPKAR